MGNLVAIVGRPNVGKSTLFNRLTQSRQAIVNDEAGTTRDRQYGKVYWTGQEFSIVDTGGWVVNSDDVFEEEINKQVAIAIEEADVILFVVDAIHGITDLDDKVAAILRRSKKPTLLVANTARPSFMHSDWETRSVSRPSTARVQENCSTQSSNTFPPKTEKKNSKKIFPVSPS